MTFRAFTFASTACALSVLALATSTAHAQAQPIIGLMLSGEPARYHPGIAQMPVGRQQHRPHPGRRTMPDPVGQNGDMGVTAAHQQQHGSLAGRFRMHSGYHPHSIACGSAIRKLCALTGLQHDIASQ